MTANSLDTPKADTCTSQQSCTGEAELKPKVSNSETQKNAASSGEHQNAASDRQARLQELRLRNQQSVLANREALQQEYRKSKLQSISNIKEQKENETSPEEAPKDKPTEEDQRKKNLNYTIKECEEWEISKPKQKGKAGSNFDELAEQAYNKTIKNLNIDKESYQTQMNLLNQKYNLSNLDDTKKLQVLLAQAPADIDKQLLINMINESKQNAHKRKRNADEESNVDSYINEKNRQFNMKLNRQYN